MRDLTIYAELWGVGDDLEREELVDEAPAVAKKDIVAIFSDNTIYADFMTWIGHPESTDSNSEAYQGFADFGLCYQSIKAVLEWESDNKS